MDAGLGDTVCWWLQQSDAARTRLFDPKPVPLGGPLERFTAGWSEATFGLGTGLPSTPCYLSKAGARVRVWKADTFAWRSVITRNLIPKIELCGT